MKIQKKIRNLTLKELSTAGGYALGLVIILESLHLGSAIVAGGSEEI
jgi:hypothetical protein